MAGNQTEVRSGLVNLITTVKEIAGTVNTDHQAFLSHQGSLGATQDRIGNLDVTMRGLETYLRDTCGKIEDRIGVLEELCKVTA